MSITFSAVRASIPSSAGVYFFRDVKNTILYVGKARNLKSRLGSYFSSSGNLTPAKVRMLKEADHITWQKCGSEIEALIEEARLIKKHRPRYNVLMRDDKNYSFVGFTKEAFPRVFLTHQPYKDLLRIYKDKKASYIGPFTDATSIKRVLRILRKLFPYCTCKEMHTRPCQHAELGLCMGFCCIAKEKLRDSSPYHDMTQKELHALYMKNIRNIRSVIEGKRASLTRTLTKDMDTAAKNQEFEKAAHIRNQLYSLERIFAHRMVIQKEHSVENAKGFQELARILGSTRAITRMEGFDISNIQGEDPVGSMVVFVDGMPQKESYRKFKIKTVRGANDPAMMYEMLSRRFLHDEWPFPDVIVVDGGMTQLHAACDAWGTYAHEYKPERTPYIISLAKREEELYIPGRIHPILLKQASPMLLHVLQHIRDEAHRFAISFHRKLHRRHVS